MREKTRALVGTGILTAIVVVLQALAVGIRFGPFSVTFVLIPIVIGAALYGWKSGAWLGFVFGVVVLFTDAGAFMAISVPATIACCIGKGALAGLAAGIVYKALEEKDYCAGVVSAAVVCPVVNTGVFLLGCLLFFYDTIAQWAAGAGFESVGTYLIVGMVGINFIVELATNIVLSTVIVRLIKIIKRKPVTAE
ncbi:MAG: ECF transporter S component [Oscillospiraceae bacterium]|nr:ECF transporter S component [Oscillospiraceae bacterium]